MFGPRSLSLVTSLEGIMVLTAGSQLTAFSHKGYPVCFLGKGMMVVALKHVGTTDYCLPEIDVLSMKAHYAVGE